MPRISFQLAILFSGVLLFGSGCSDRDAEQVIGAVNPLQQNLYTQFERRARTLAADARTRVSSTPVPNHDAALFIHPLEPVEFWVYLALLRDEQGQRYAVQQRFARLQIVAETGEKTLTTGQSQWDYTHILAIDAQFKHLTGDLKEVHTDAQREALTLAGVDEPDQRVWVGAFDSRIDSSSICQKTIVLNSPQVSLRFGGVDRASATCEDNSVPQPAQIAGFSVLRSVALPVTGRFVRDAQAVSLAGYGWVVQGWGVPPDASSAAVVFDRAWLLMDNDMSVQLQRSRRASGRGPRISSGSVYRITSPSGSAVTPLGIETVLADAEQKTSNQLPVSWQLSSPENAMELKLTPVSTDQASANILGQSWFGVVSIDGSQQGYGFVDYSLR